jgi:hypothetical protein
MRLQKHCTFTATTQARAQFTQVQPRRTIGQSQCSALSSARVSRLDTRSAPSMESRQRPRRERERERERDRERERESWASNTDSARARSCACTRGSSCIYPTVIRQLLAKIECLTASGKRFEKGNTIGKDKRFEKGNKIGVDNRFEEGNEIGVDTRFEKGNEIGKANRFEGQRDRQGQPL